MMNTAVKTEMIADEYQIETERSLKKEGKLGSTGILESRLVVKIESVKIENNCENMDTAHKGEHVDQSLNPNSKEGTKLISDVDDRKLFVGGLPEQAKVGDIQDYFQKFGRIEDINLKTYSRVRSGGFAFVVFKTIDGLEQALATLTHVLMGKDIILKKAEYKPGKVYVGKLTDELSSEQIQFHFSKFGKITLFERPGDKKRKRRDYCFITFEKDTCAKQLIKIGKTTINGVHMEVKKVTLNQKTTMGNSKPEQMDMMRMNGFVEDGFWLNRPMPFFGPRPYFGGWHNFGPRPFGPMNNFGYLPTFQPTFQPTFRPRPSFKNKLSVSKPGKNIPVLNSLSSV